MAYKLLIVCILASVFTKIQTAKILGVFSMPSISHQVVFRKLTQELCNRGHDVTVITTDPAYPNGGAPENLTEIDLHYVSYNTWRKLFQDDYKVNQDFVSFTEMRRFSVVMGNIFKAQMEDPAVKKLLNDPNQKFDLILIEPLIRHVFAFSHIYKAPTILINSLGALFNTHQIMGSPTHPLLFPTPLHLRIYNLTFWEKIKELYTHFSVDYAVHLNAVEENALIREIFGPQVPPLSELYDNVDMLFINIHPVWADNQPVPPNVIYMGGIHQSPEKELPHDLKEYLDSSKNGVIYLSFGTNVLSGMISPDKLKIIIKVLSNLPYDVLWKWDKEDLPGKSDNIKISKWFPQSDLLRHPKIKLFITQAGLQSTDEAITAGVPLVAIPMLGDQWFNAEKYVKHGIGAHLDIETLTADLLKDTIETVINDDTYRKNIIKLRELLRDQPEAPLQRAVWWAEYVIRNGGAKHLRASSANMSLFQYFEVNLILAVLAMTFTALFSLVVSIIYATKLLKSIMCSTSKVKIN